MQIVAFVMLTLAWWVLLLVSAVVGATAAVGTLPPIESIRDAVVGAIFLVAGLLAFGGTKAIRGVTRNIGYWWRSSALEREREAREERDHTIAAIAESVMLTNGRRAGRGRK